MTPAFKRESWRPHAQPTSSWAPGRADTFRPAQDGPSSGSSSRQSPPPAGPSNYNSRPHAASTYRPAQDRDASDRTPPSRPRYNDREDTRRDGPSEGDRGWASRNGPDSRRGDAGRLNHANDPRERAGQHEPHKGGYGRDYNEALRSDDIKKGTFRTKAQIQADLREQQRGQRQNRSPPPESPAGRPGGASKFTLNDNEVRSADRSGSTWNGRGDARDRGSNLGRPVRDVSSPRGRLRSRSPIRQRNEPARGRRASPDYGNDRSDRRRSPSRDSLYSPIPRKRSLSLIRDSLSPVDRKRAPTSPRGGPPKRQRDLSPSRSITPPRRRRSSTQSRSRSRERIRRPRSPSPRRNHRRSPSPHREAPRRPMRQWGRRPSPDRSPISDRRDRSPPPPPRQRSPSPLPSRNRAESSSLDSTPAGRGPPFGGWGRAAADQSTQQRSMDSYRPASQSNAPSYPQDRGRPFEAEKSPISHTNGHVRPQPFQQLHSPAQNDTINHNAANNGYSTLPVTSTEEAPLPSGTIRVSLSNRDLSPVKGGWKSMSHPASSKPAAVRQFFDDSASNTPYTSRSPSPPLDSAPSRHPPIDSDRPPLRPPEVYSRLLHDAQRDFQIEFDKLAPPYLRAAFQSWYAQSSRPDLPDFLGHYFGRRPQNQEITQMEILLGLQNRFSRDQEELRDLHRQASQADARNSGQSAEPTRPTRRDSAGHWSPPRGPRGQRESWSPQKRDVPLPGPPASANLVPIPEGKNRFARSGPSRSDVPEPQAATVSHSPIGETDSTPAKTKPAASPSFPEPIQTVTKPAPRVNASGEVYERLAHVGEGTYGKVYKARNVETGGLFALKRIRMEGEKDGFPVTAMREIKLLQGLRHRNVMRLVEMMVSKGSVYMVSEYMDHDLTGVLAQADLKFTPANLKSLNHQMLSGLAYLHESGILHRDMKGSNILLNAAGELKLADFGLARTYSKRKREDYTNRVITLWYRGPELLLGETVYGPEVDMWSAGCIMLELFCGKPVFQGSDEIHQLEVIYSIMGTPDESRWPTVKELPWYELVKPKEALPSKFRESFKKWLTPAGMDLAQGLLEFDTTKRLSAEAALQAPYFTQEEPEMELPTQLANCGEHHEMSAKLERHRKRQQEGR